MIYLKHRFISLRIVCYFFKYSLKYIIFYKKNVSNMYYRFLGNVGKKIILNII